ncbi:MAG: hypothetical protein R3212_02700, partial [Xanthomonadales bacterium]|nr:hypothetical protein [Xanthomonadales bacterium]
QVTIEAAKRAIEEAAKGSGDSTDGDRTGPGPSIKQQRQAEAAQEVAAATKQESPSKPPRTPVSAGKRKPRKGSKRTRKRNGVHGATDARP